MKLTIVIPDKLVCKDGLCYTPLDWDGLDTQFHALQWDETEGWIEFTDARPNSIITELPQWATNALNAWDVANQPKSEEPPPAYLNKAKAVSYLANTDWASIPDVSDPTKSNPYLINVQDYVNYRNVLRAIAVNPPEGFINWPTPPAAQWGTND
jgi:hypothetical protein